MKNNLNASPEDLMALNEICSKYGFDYNYLYKWSVIMGVINVYFRGTWKLSIQEVLNFSNNQAKEKLRKLKTRKIGA